MVPLMMPWMLASLMIGPVPVVQENPPVSESDPATALFPLLLARKMELEDLELRKQRLEDEVHRLEEQLSDVRRLYQQGAAGRSLVDQARTSLEIARSRLLELEATQAIRDHEMDVRTGVYRGGPEQGYRLLLQSLRAQLHSAEVDAAYRERRYQKNVQLSDQGAVSRDQLDHSSMDRNAARSRVAQLRSREAQVELERTSFQSADDPETRQTHRRLRIRALRNRIVAQRYLIENSRMRLETAIRARGVGGSNAKAVSLGQIEELRDLLQADLLELRNDEALLKDLEGEDRAETDDINSSDEPNPDTPR